MRLKREVWRSTHQRCKVHWFVPAGTRWANASGDRGYQHNTYLFGYNPKLVYKRTVEKILRLIEQQKGKAMSFKSVQKKIEKKDGVSKKSAGAILANASRNASASAKKKNPKLKKVKG